MSGLKIMNKVIAVLFIILVLLSIPLGIMVRRIDMPRYTYTLEEENKAIKQLQNEYDTSYPALTKEEYKELVENDLDFKMYIYAEMNLDKWNANGVALILIRTIIIDDDVDISVYPMVLAHEILHFKKLSNNEKFICLETFKYLYHNDDVQLKNIGILYGLQQLGGAYVGDYEIKEYIIKEIKK